MEKMIILQLYNWHIPYARSLPLIFTTFSLFEELMVITLFSNDELRISAIVLLFNHVGVGLSCFVALQTLIFCLFRWVIVLLKLSLKLILLFMTADSNVEV